MNRLDFLRRLGRFGGLAGLLVLSACENGQLLGETIPNSPPDTQVEATPPNLEGASFRIEFYWSGSDPDGVVSAFEWIITDNGPDNVFDPADTTSGWRLTTSTDSLFVVSANLPDYPGDVGSIDQIKNVRFWQTHTFFVRAIDDRGRRDPSPARVSFTATTITPRIEIIEPTLVQPSTCYDGPLALSFEWEVNDPDNDEGSPGDVRYTLIRWGDPTEECLSDLDFSRDDPIASIPEDRWSPWIPYDAGSDSGRIKRYPISDQPPGTSFLFAVQARDVAGAVTPVFEFGKNVRHVRTTTQKFPLLTVEESSLGTKIGTGRGNIARFDLVAGQPLDFQWSARASSYGGVVEEYRYGFNVTDPENAEDPNWAVPWGPSWRAAERPAGFAQGSPNFVVLARDNSGAISSFTYQFQVIQVKARQDQRPLLVIDDAKQVTSDRLDTFYDAVWTNHLLGVQGFSSTTDVLDVSDGVNPSFALANEYRALLWIVSKDTDTYFAKNLAPATTESVRFNWLEIYQKLVGNVMLAGPRVMRNSIEPAPERSFIYPIVFNTSLAGNRGLGTTINAEGRTINIGTLRYPYTAWCLEAIDEVDPVNVGRLQNPRGRERACDAATYLRVTAEYVDRFRPPPARVSSLEPTPARRSAGFTDNLEELEFFGQMGMIFEEVYNHNAPNRPIVLNLRDCQVPMFEMIARMDVDDVAIMQDPSRGADYHLDPEPRLVPTTEDPETGQVIEDCAAVRIDGRLHSTLTGAPMVIASTQYVTTKQNGAVPFEDYLWGLDPLGFERAEVKSVIEWILLNRWALNAE